MIKVLIQADSRYPIERARIRKLVTEFLTEQEVTTDMSIGVVVIGDRKMKELNWKYLKVEGTTDVLSFSQMDEGSTGEQFVQPGDIENHLGDVVVSWPQAVKQAMERNITIDDEIDFLIKHGILHLLGIHHD